LLTADQIDAVWEGQLSSEIRSLYFSDLANLYSARKQWITGLTFFLSSGAVVTLFSHLPVVLPIAFSLTIALMTAYSVAVNLDAKIRTMAKLHYGWSQVANDFRRLWNHTYAEDAELELRDLEKRTLELSELATTEAPNDPKRMSHWQDRVVQLYRLEAA
jgi:hypothetical protein